MTTAARLVLNDCQHALAKHTADLQAEEFRVSWIAVVTLLRAVGHVLQKIDSEQSRHMKAAIDAAWANVMRGKPAKEPAILWSFIEEERNSVIKAYELGVSRIARSAPVSPGEANLGIDLATMQGKRGHVTSAKLSGFAFITSEITSGPFKGRDEREVAAEAIAWWEHYLDEIDREAARLAEAVR